MPNDSISTNTRVSEPAYSATSKPTVFATEIARHFDFARYFKAIYGSELDGTRTNKVELIAHLLKQEGLDPTDTLMIGDRKHDLIGAHGNGVRAVAVGYGFGSLEAVSYTHLTLPTILLV